MQNKHDFFPFWESQRTGRGGGQAGWAKFPTLGKNLFCASFPYVSQMSEIPIKMCMWDFMFQRSTNAEEVGELIKLGRYLLQNISN